MLRFFDVFRGLEKGCIDKERVKKLRTLQSNQCLWKTAKTFELQDDTKLVYEVQKYKCMYDKAYKQHLFSLSRTMSFTQTKLSFD